MNKPGPGGSGPQRLTPLELLDRLAALVPPPRIHRHRYFGVLAGTAAHRKSSAQPLTAGCGRELSYAIVGTRSFTLTVLRTEVQKPERVWPYRRQLGRDADRAAKRQTRCPWTAPKLDFLNRDGWPINPASRVA